MSSNAAIGLGHQRLSVVDLSESGAQPMVSRSGRTVVAFNGEIYNHQALRKELLLSERKIEFRGTSDTEVLVELVDAMGVEKALSLIDGMFAFAAIDRLIGKVWLARDPFGEKPLYFSYINGELVFGSELQALSIYPGFKKEIAPGSAASYFKYGYVPGTTSIYSSVCKVPPGSFVSVSIEEVAKKSALKPITYWDAATRADNARAKLFVGQYSDGIDALQEKLETVVKNRRSADVPVGTFLSGGIDSSLVTAILQRHSNAPVKTFTIGSTDVEYDESSYARSVSEFLGTSHTELVLTPSQMRDSLSRCATAYDEPFADSSQIPTFLVSELARKDVTVVLTGDGADELFGGYNRHFRAAKLWKSLDRIPVRLRLLIAGRISSASIESIASLARVIPSSLNQELKAGRTAEKLKKLGALISAPDFETFQDRLLQITPDINTVLIDGLISKVIPMEFVTSHEAFEFSRTEQTLLIDSINYLPDDILVKVDRATMAVALESRAPFLSKDLYELAWSFPTHWKVRDGRGKVVLRDLLNRYIPKHITDRPKAGFAIPIGRWLRKELREWAEPNLTTEAISDIGFLRPEEVRRRWQEHLNGTNNHEAFFWAILSYQMWTAKDKPQSKPD